MNEHNQRTPPLRSRRHVLGLPDSCGCVYRGSSGGSGAKCGDGLVDWVTLMTTQYPDMAEAFCNMEHRHERQRVESALARTFVNWMNCEVPAERSLLWQEMFQLGRELEKLNNDD